MFLRQNVLLARVSGNECLKTKRWGTEKEIRGLDKERDYTAGKKKRLSDMRTVSDKVLEDEKKRKDRERKTSTFLSQLSSCPHHSFSCFLFLWLPPHPSLSLSPPCSFLMLSPLTPQGSLSFPAFSCCFIYSLFNSPRCICSPFLFPRPPLPLPHSPPFSVSVTHPPPVRFSHQLFLPYRPHLLKMPLVLERFYGQFISLGVGFHFLYNSCPSLSVMQAILFTS